MYFLLQSSIIFAVCASNIRWHWTPNGYLASVLGVLLGACSASISGKSRRLMSLAKPRPVTCATIHCKPAIGAKRGCCVAI